jgi:hypothetical protein
MNKMNIYKINKYGDFKFKKVINIDDYIFVDTAGTQGIDIKHKKNGRSLELRTKEFYEMGIDEYSDDENIMKMVFSSNYIHVEDCIKLINAITKLPNGIKIFRIYN